MAQKVKILGVVGSMEHNSIASQALKMALESASKAGAEPVLIELNQYELPILGSTFTHPNSDADVKKLKKEFASAQGFILATPEYHGSVSGALKNALDHMGFDEFEGKMAGLIGVAGGALGAGNALNHLRVICRQLHAWVVPSEVSIASSHQAFDLAGKPKDPQLSNRLQKLGTEVAQFALLHNQEAWKDFVKLWEQSVQNPGGEGR